MLTDFEAQVLNILKSFSYTNSTKKESLTLDDKLFGTSGFRIGKNQALKNSKLVNTIAEELNIDYEFDEDITGMTGRDLVNDLMPEEEEEEEVSTEEGEGEDVKEEDDQTLKDDALDLALTMVSEPRYLEVTMKEIGNSTLAKFIVECGVGLTPLETSKNIESYVDSLYTSYHLKTE